MKKLSLLFIVLFCIIQTNIYGQSPFKSAGGFLTAGTGTNMHSSAILEARSTTKGVLFPKMTTTQMNAIASPAEGLLIFNLTSGSFKYYHSGVWTDVGNIVGIITGTGTNNKIPKFTGTNILGNSQISDDGTSMSINSAPSTAKFNVKGDGSTQSTKNTSMFDSNGREIGSLTDSGNLTINNKSTDDSNTITASINTDLGGGGKNFVGLSNGVQTFIVDRSGNIVASNIVSHDIFSSGNIYVIGGNGLVCTNTGNVNSTNTFLGTHADKWESNVRLKYATDLSSSYDDRTLVDKQYVTNHTITPIGGNNISIDYTDPINPIINENTLGKITITGLSSVPGLDISDISSAHNWLTQYTNATITDESFVDYVYRFTVPTNSDFSLATEFCGTGFENVQFEDPLGLVTVFGDNAFLQNNQNNIIGNVVAGDSFFSQSIGNNTIGNINVGNDFLYGSYGNNIIGNVITLDDFLIGSHGNNIIGNVTAVTSCLLSSTGNNTIGNVIAGNYFLKSSSGNNVMGNVTAGSFFLQSSTSNNTMQTINVLDNAFNNAFPSIKNSIYKIQSCDYNFAFSYSGRMDISLFGVDGTQNLPFDFFMSGNLVWINTSYKNRYINAGSEDFDITQLKANFNNHNVNNNTVNFEGIEDQPIPIDLSGYELLSNKQTNLTSSATKYPTIDAVNTGLTTKQDALVSGTSIKTINGNSILSSGNIVVGDALTTGNLTQFASNTSAEIASKVTNETGNGSLVFNNDPAFTGTATFATIQINGGLSSEYIQGNGGTSNFATGVRAVTMALGTLSNTVVSGGETVSAAFGKLQGQINARAQYFTNNTTTTLSSATLNSTYPTATTGTHVYCTSILVGAMIYERTLTGWIGWTIFVP